LAEINPALRQGLHRCRSQLTIMTAPRKTEPTSTAQSIISRHHAAILWGAEDGHERGHTDHDAVPEAPDKPV